MKRSIFYLLSVTILSTSSAYTMESEDKPHSHKYIPKNKVKTLEDKETNIFTNFFYKISLKGNSKVIDHSKNKDNIIKLELPQDDNNYQAWSLLSIDPDSQGYIVGTTYVADNKVLDSGKESTWDLFHSLGVKKWELHDPKHEDYNRQIWVLKESPFSNLSQ